MILLDVKYSRNDKHVNTFRPCSQKSRDWPTLVFKTGVSEGLLGLRRDAEWWLENTKDVNIVIVVSTKKEDGSWLIEKWEHARNPIARLTRSHQSVIPTMVQSITVSLTIPEGSPTLIFEFEELFLRPAINIEHDITWTTEDLKRMAKRF